LVSQQIPFLSRLPFLVAAIILGAATVCVAVVRLSEPLPITPWESAIAMEAMRLNAGLPLYEAGHATHLYGPLLTVLLAGIFRITGLNLLAARIAFSTFSLVLAIVLSVILCRGKLRKYWLIALLLFLAINFRTNLICLSAQPDCAAALFGVTGLYFWIARRNSLLRAALSVAFFLCAVLLKQTSAAFALIPFVYALIWRHRFYEAAVSLVPALSVLVALALIRLTWPQMFLAIVTTPASISVHYERTVGIAIYLVATFPIFLIALITTFFSRGRIDETERWVWSAIIVLVPVSVWTICKSGGSYSSLLFAYLAMTALFVIKLDTISNWIAALPRWRSFLAATVIALSVLFSFFIQFDRAFGLLFTRCGDEKYDSAVAAARRLDGVVISPQDPTIAYRASGYFGRSLFFELDAHAVNGNWPGELPESMRQELAQARYVIEVHSYVPTPAFERGLVNNHFYPAPIEALSNSVYALWTRKSE
jgi:hypothetical protein